MKGQRELVYPIFIYDTRHCNIILIFNQEHLRPEHFCLKQEIGLLLPTVEKAQWFDSACTVARTAMKVCELHSSETSHSPCPETHVCISLSSGLAYNVNAVGVLSELSPRISVSPVWMCQSFGKIVFLNLLLALILINPTELN